MGIKTLHPVFVSCWGGRVISKNNLKHQSNIDNACVHVQMWHLLNDQIRATEGFRFQGLQPIRDHVELILDSLCVAAPAKGSPLLKGGRSPAATPLDE